MKSSIAIASLLATSVLAKPLHDRLHEKRRFKFFEDVDTVYTTVTATAGSGWNWGSWSGSDVDADATTAAPIPVVTEDPLATGWGVWDPSTDAAADATTAAPVPVVTEDPLATGWGVWDPSTDAAAVPTAPAPIPVVTEDPVATVTINWQAPPPTPDSVQSPPDTASATDSSPSSWTSSPSQGTGPGGVDIAAILDQHNNHRANASVPALTWSTDLANIAAAIAQSCVYAHNT
jgi:Cysteine-rich secretory protein family